MKKIEENLWLVNSIAAQEELTKIRDKRTSQVVFRKGLVKIGRICGYELMEILDKVEIEAETPLAKFKGVSVSDKERIVIINVLRAAFPFVEGILKAFPLARQGIISAKRKDKKLVINKKEAEIVRMIFEKYVETDSINRVYDFLKEKNIKNRQGKIFSKDHLALILRNIAYTGKINYAGEIYQGIHQPIISQELFELAQKTHKRRIRKFRIYRDFLFGGLIKCKECGYTMSAEGGS